MILLRSPSGVSRGKLISPRQKLLLPCFVASVLISGHAENQSQKNPKRKPNAAFMSPVQPDDKLSAIVGSKPLPRSELTKKLWDYIKKTRLSG